MAGENGEIKDAVVDVAADQTNVLERLGNKSEAKIESSEKSLEAIKTPSAETVTTLKDALEVIADPPAKTEGVVDTDPAKAALAENERKIAEERAAGKTGADIEVKVEEPKIVKNHWEEEETPGTPAAEAKPTDKDKDKVDTGLLKKYESQAKEYEDLLKDPLIASYQAAKQAGKDVGSFLEEIKPENIKSLSDEQVWEKELRLNNLSDEDVKVEIERFKEMGAYQRKTTIDPIRTKLEGLQTEKLKKYASENSVLAQESGKIAAKIVEEKEQYLNSKKGKVEMGLEMTPARLQEVSDYIDTFSLQRADKSVDVARIARFGMFEKNYKQILQNAYNKGLNDAKISTLKEIARPSGEDGGLKVIPDQRSETKKDVEAFRNKLR